MFCLRVRDGSLLNPSSACDDREGILRCAALDGYAVSSSPQDSARRVFQRMMISPWGQCLKKWMLVLWNARKCGYWRKEMERKAESE